MTPILIPAERLPLVPEAPANPVLAALAREILWSLNRMELLSIREHRVRTERN